MSQPVKLGHLIRFPCLSALCALQLAALGCRPSLGLVTPDGMEPLSSETEWAWIADLVPTEATLYDLRWTFRTQQGATRGRAAIRLVPPDSIRFDYRGPFGRSGAAVVVGDSVVWAEPEEDASEIIPVAPLFWAAIGVARQAPVGSDVYGLQVGPERFWRYDVAGDVLTYVVSRDPGLKLQTEMRRMDQLVGVVETVYSDSTGAPHQAIMTFPATASQFLFEFRNVEKLESVDPDVWKRP